MEADKKKMRKDALLVLLIFALAFFLRVYDLGKESIWLDEGFALEAISRNASDVVKWTASFDPIPPFYYIVLHYWSGIFGTGEFAIRFLSLILSMAAMLVIFLLTKKMFNMKVGIIAAAIFATEMLQVQYAQEARSFVLFMLLAWLSTLLFYYFLTEKKYLIPYVIVSALALYTLQLMVAVLIMHNTIFFLQKGEAKKWLLAQGSIIILFLPWIGIFLKQFMLIHQLFQAGMLQRLQLPYFIGVLGILWLLIAAASAFAIFLLFYLKKKGELVNILHNEMLFAATVAAAIGVYLFMLPRLISSFIPARYFLFALPALYIYFAHMISRMKRRKVAAFLLIAVLLLNCFSLYSYYSKTTKAEWREAVSYISEHAREGDVVVMDTGFSEMLYRYYGGNLPGYGLVERPFSLERHQQYIEQLKPELKQKKGVWLILYRNYVTKELYKDALDKDFELSSEKQFKEIRVYYYGQ